MSTQHEIRDAQKSLPEPAAKKLLALAGDADEAHAALLHFNRQVDDARQAKKRAEVRLQAKTDEHRGWDIERRYAGTGELAPPQDKPPDLAAAEDALKEAAADLDALLDRQESLQARWQVKIALVTRLISCAQAMPPIPKDGKIDDFLAPAIDPKIGKGETHHAALDRRRKALADLRADLHAVRSAPIPSSSAKERARAEVARLAAAGRPDLLGLVEAATPIRWPEKFTMPVTAGMAVPTGFNQPDGIGLLAWLHGDALVAALDKEIDALADDEHALDDETRAAREAEIKVAMLKIEREEERLIELADAEGMTILRRQDADPRAVLGLADAVPWREDDL